MIVLTALIALFTFLTWRTYKRIEWFTGAFTSHSMLATRIAAHEQKIRMVWWDPTKEPVPRKPVHGEPVDVEPIYQYVPLEMRSKQPTLWSDIEASIRRGARYLGIC